MDKNQAVETFLDRVEELLGRGEAILRAERGRDRISQEGVRALAELALAFRELHALPLREYLTKRRLPPHEERDVIKSLRRYGVLK